MKLISLLVLLIAFYYFINNQIGKNKSKSPVKKISKLHEKISYGLKVIDKIFNKHKIYYTIAYGTLLGAVRHWNIIEWDDDADIHILKKDLGKILSLKDEFKKHGLILEQNWKLLKIYFDKSKYPFIDLFVIEENKEKTNRCKAKSNPKKCISLKAKWWKGWYNFPYKWLIDRKRLRLGDLTLWAPKESIKILKFWYGKKCLKDCYTSNYNHITGKYIKSQKKNCINLPIPQK